MPTVKEICTTFGLKDVPIRPDEADDVDLTKYRSFSQYARAVLGKENPDVAFGTMTMLVSAKWREFSSQKSAQTEETASSLPLPSAADPEEEETPTTEEVCTKYGLKDVEIQYRQVDFEKLTNYDAFTRFVRPILNKNNRKVAASKIMMLVAAKWREFFTQKHALEQTPPDTPPSPAPEPEKKVMPTVQEVCSTYGLNDVEIDYDEAGDEHLANYRSFTRHVRPFVSKVNPKVPSSKILMLVAAKWREFSSQNRSDDQIESDENKENEPNGSSKPTQSRAKKRKAQVDEDVGGADEKKIENRVTRGRGGRNQESTEGQEDLPIRGFGGVKTISAARLIRKK